MSRSVFAHKAVQPCLPKPAKEHDGFRILARRDGNSVL
jgi:hypothetical protein